MFDIIVLIFLFVGVMAVTAVLFGGWVLVSILRFLFRAFTGASYDTAAPPRRLLQVRCPRDRCGASNPAGAQFCRRCGHELTASDAYAGRRAAMW